MMLRPQRPRWEKEEDRCGSSLWLSVLVARPLLRSLRLPRVKGIAEYNCTTLCLQRTRAEYLHRVNECVGGVPRFPRHHSMMDKYHSIHGQDEASFDLTATHRLPTVSAADALEDLDDATSRYVSTGLPDLDEALGSASAACDDHHRPTAASKRAGGIPRGQVAEIWGPPGVGKTALGPTATTLPKDTAVVVVSSLSTLVNHAFPKSSENRPGPQLGKGPSLAARRLQTLQHIVSALQKLAATRNCAVVVLTQCATKMQAESGATLVPAINANVWEQGVSTRLVVFKDWAWKDGSPSTVCLAGVQKLEGRAGSEAVSSAAAFRIEAVSRRIGATPSSPIWQGGDPFC
ncbi:hypothetical protein BN1723_015209 [Verticillium longisporum]|uniref:RecA family profile 1 domain-containing protein n=1 Tax=Verticillium longisporum TaxID=100787 RepID=A0A0G4MTP3_VERLO|nr:hypothetical protein BN1723_015209 [Verticillium longisporum]